MQCEIRLIFIVKALNRSDEFWVLFGIIIPFFRLIEIFIAVELWLCSSQGVRMSTYAFFVCD